MLSNRIINYKLKNNMLIKVIYYIHIYIFIYTNLVEKNVDDILIYHIVHTKLFWNFKMYSIIIIIYLLISNLIKYPFYYKH